MADDVTVKHPEYSATFSQWERSRDCFEGQDSLRAKNTKYIPALRAHHVFDDGSAEYTEYRDRALFFNAVRRTVFGLAGSIFQKTPEVDAPDAMEKLLDDITLTDTSAEEVMATATREAVLIGRYGVLVEYSTTKDSQKARPYWVTYDAEEITNWRVEDIDGDPTLTMVEVREVALEPSKNNRFLLEPAAVYRILELVDGVYTQTTWKEAQPGGKRFVAGETITPKRRGETIPFIPFVFIGAISTTPDVERPPLLDLVDVNLSHFQNSADLENGLHCLGLPQMVLTGATATEGDPVPLGSANVIFLPQGGTASLLQADGERFGALERSLDRKKKDMATLGARMLEEQTGGAETATAVSMRHAGEHATLRSVAGVIERAFTQLMQYTIWWAGFDKMPDDVKTSVEFNKDFYTTPLAAGDLQALVAALQAESISYQTFWFLLGRGESARPGVTWEDELKAIHESREEFGPNPNAAPPPPGAQPPPPDDEDDLPGLTEEDKKKVKDKAKAGGKTIEVVRDKDGRASSYKIKED